MILEWTGSVGVSAGTGSSMDSSDIDSSVTCLTDVVGVLVVGNLRLDLGETNKG